MVYIKKTNKTEKTAKIYVPYEKKALQASFHGSRLQSLSLLLII